MAKNKAKTDLPTIDEVEVGGVEQVRGYDMAAEAMQSVAVEAPPVTSRTVSVPLAQIPFGYLPRVCDVRKLTGRQSQALRQLQEALSSQGAKLANGSRINNPSNAIKWLLESIAG
jgi:hypothetical protein